MTIVYSTLSRKAAREAVRYVEKALRDGYQLNGIPSAIEEASRRYAKEVDRKLSRGGFQSRIRIAKNLYGIEPKLPKNPPEPKENPEASQNWWHAPTLQDRSVAGRGPAPD